MLQAEKVTPANETYARASTPTGWGIRLAYFFLDSTPLGWLVRQVAAIQASVHAKLITGFFIVTFLVVAMGGLSLQVIHQTAQQSLLLDEAHKSVEWSRQIQHELALQMNFTAMALLLKDEATVAKILRANNRFNNYLALIAEAASADEQGVIDQIRAAQGTALTTVADIANLLRDGKASEAMSLQQNKGYPLYEQIAGLVDQVVAGEQSKMAGLRANVAAATRRTQLLMAVFVIVAILLALLLGFVISWSFILPVRQADVFLDHVAAGNFGATIAVPNRDEFGSLADRMNHMSQELHALRITAAGRARSAPGAERAAPRPPRPSPSSWPT